MAVIFTQHRFTRLAVLQALRCRPSYNNKHVHKLIDNQSY